MPIGKSVYNYDFRPLLQGSKCTMLHNPRFYVRQALELKLPESVILKLSVKRAPDISSFFYLETLYYIFVYSSFVRE